MADIPAAGEIVWCKWPGSEFDREGVIYARRVLAVDSLVQTDPRWGEELRVKSGGNVHLLALAAKAAG